MFRWDVEARDQPRRVVVTCSRPQRGGLNSSVESRAGPSCTPTDWGCFPVCEHRDGSRMIIDRVDQQCPIAHSARCVEVLDRGYVPGAPTSIGCFIRGEQNIEIGEVPRLNGFESERGGHQITVARARSTSRRAIAYRGCPTLYSKSPVGGSTTMWVARTSGTSSGTKGTSTWLWPVSTTRRSWRSVVTTPETIPS